MVDCERALLEIRPGSSLDLFGGSDFEEMLIDVSALVSDEGSELRAVAFAWLGVVPSDGQLWFWCDRDRTGVAYLDDRAVARPAADDVFEAVAARLVGASPFEEEFVRWEGLTGLRAIVSTIAG